MNTKCMTHNTVNSLLSPDVTLTKIPPEHVPKSHVNTCDYICDHMLFWNMFMWNFCKGTSFLSVQMVVKGKCKVNYYFMILHVHDSDT